jgi:2-polyprenyl-6-methoxyphenol hydroxylase-like FAD-dependent oxidoreductase
VTGTTRATLTLMPRNAAQAQRWEEASGKGRQILRELLREEFADAGWQSRRLLDAMDSAPDFYFLAIEQIRMPNWSTGRVICLGDTAYAPSLLTGMGTSLAIVGAYLLAGD